MNRMARRCLAVLVTVAAVATAAAQQSDVKLPPFYDVPAIEDSRPWLQWIVGTVFIAACLGVAIRNPHRSHLD